MKVGVIFGLLLFLQSCSTSLVVEGTVPVPLVSKIPARVGVYYSDEFRHFQHTEKMRDSGSWTIDLGEQNMVFFESLMDSLFDQVIELEELPVSANVMQDLDGVVIPEIDKYGFLTPYISGLKFHSASIEYRIVILDTSGGQVGNWNIVGYGKSEGKLFGAEEAINESTVLAIRDGGARIAIELIDQPAVREWIKRIDGGDPLPDSQQDETSDLDGTDLDGTNLDSTDRDSTGPDVTRSDVTQSDVTQSDLMNPTSLGLELSSEV